MGAEPGFLEELLVHGFRDRVIYVDADQVHQLKRSHREAALSFYDTVDVFHRCDSFTQNSERFAVERTRNAIHNKAGGIFRPDTRFSELIAEVNRPLHCFLGGLCSLHHFDKLHHMNRVEKMQSDDPLGSFHS